MPRTSASWRYASSAVSSDRTWARKALTLADELRAERAALQLEVTALKMQAKRPGWSAGLDEYHIDGTTVCVSWEVQRCECCNGHWAAACDADLYSEHATFIQAVEAAEAWAKEHRGWKGPKS